MKKKLDMKKETMNPILHGHLTEPNKKATKEVEGSMMKTHLDKKKPMKKEKKRG